MLTYFLVLILTSGNGDHPKPPVMFPQALTSEACEAKGASLVAELGARPDIAAVGKVTFRCIELYPSGL